MSKKEKYETKADKEVAVPQASVPQTADVMPEGYWGEAPQVGSHERLIPKLLLMQGQSPLVQEGKCMVGQIANSVTAQVFGNKDKPVLFIPLEKLPSTWVVSDVDVNDPQVKTFKEIVNINAQNENLPWEEKDAQGRLCLVRVYSINFLVLVADDLGGLPYTLSFRGTSVKTGKKVVNHFEQSFKDKKPPAKYALALSCKQDVNDNKQTYWVMEIDSSKKRETTPEELKVAWEWFQTYKKNAQAFRFDNSDVEREGRAPAAEPGKVAANAQY